MDTVYVKVVDVKTSKLNKKIGSKTSSKHFYFSFLGPYYIAVFVKAPLTFFFLISK